MEEEPAAPEDPALVFDGETNNYPMCCCRSSGDDDSGVDLHSTPSMFIMGCIFNLLN